MEPSTRYPTEPRRVRLVYEVRETPDRWFLDEDDMPETPLHAEIITVLVAVLRYWVKAGGRNAMVARNLGCRWEPDDARVGMDPDVVLIEPAPPEGEKLPTLRVWQSDHAAPRIAVEVVSEHTAEKDYRDAPVRAGLLGVRELWVFDPELKGPDHDGGPYLLQVWQAADGGMERVHAGDAPARSDELDGWLVTTDGGTRLRLAEDATGETLWPTAAEAAEAEVERLKALLGDKR